MDFFTLSFRFKPNWWIGSPTFHLIIAEMLMEQRDTKISINGGHILENLVFGEFFQSILGVTSHINRARNEK